MTKRELAINYFKQGYNCAQAVALAFSDEMGLTYEVVAMMASPFGGGMGRMREVCGAVSGMIMVLGKLEGSYDPTNSSSKMEIYQKVQFLAGKFKEKNGTIVCRELLNLPSGEDSPKPEERTTAYYKKRPCAELCGDAAEILDDYLKNK